LTVFSFAFSGMGTALKQQLSWYTHYSHCLYLKHIFTVYCSICSIAAIFSLEESLIRSKKVFILNNIIRKMGKKMENKNLGQTWAEN